MFGWAVYRRIKDFTEKEKGSHDEENDRATALSYYDIFAGGLRQQFKYRQHDAGRSTGRKYTGKGVRAGASEAAPAESGKDTGIKGSTLEVAVTYTGDQATTFQGLIWDFEAEYGCTVNIAEYGVDYENTMKTRMASNDLPGVFQTHSWSILRYKEYLMNLSTLTFRGKLLTDEL